VRELFDAFFDETRRRVDQLRAAAESGDRVEPRRTAHAIKGSAGSFGARELSRLAGEIEERSGPRATEPVDELVDRAAVAFRATQPALEAILSRR
jgi:HPt (histidine-containing phosphotransfer) domain-containing protein